MEPKIVRPDEAHQVRLNDVLFDYGFASEDTDGQLSMLQVTIPPKTLVKPHMHSREDEFTLILSGTVGARLGENTTEEIPAGSWLAKPRGVPHAMWNISDEPARILEVDLPGGLESYFEAIAPVLKNHGPDWTKQYYALAEAHGLEILDDWSDELKARYGITL
jgi:quercetin dioxygenase-like cupin family protein